MYILTKKQGKTIHLKTERFGETVIKDDLKAEAHEKKRKAIEASFARVYKKALVDVGMVKLEAVYQEVAEDTGYCQSTVRAELKGYFKKEVEK
jgi:hypothetical protein